MNVWPLYFIRDNWAYIMGPNHNKLAGWPIHPLIPAGLIFSSFVHNNTCLDARFQKTAIKWVQSFIDVWPLYFIGDHRAYIMGPNHNKLAG